MKYKNRLHHFFALFLLIALILPCITPAYSVKASNHSENYTLRKGIDVSRWQTKLDWNAIKKEGVEFVIIKFGGRDNDGDFYVDSKFEEHIEGALAAGLKVGVYFWSEAINEQEAIEEVDFIVSKIYKYNISLPIFMDYEWCPENRIDSCRIYNTELTREQRTATINAFIKRCKHYHYAGAAYLNRNFIRNFVNIDSIYENGKLWLASYSSPQWTGFVEPTTTYEGDLDFIQFTSEGKLTSVNGNLDLDYWYDDGTINGQDYSTVFDPIYYANRYTDLYEKYGHNVSELLNHFIYSGMAEGRQGCANFDVQSYIFRYKDLRNAFGNDVKKYYEHYIAHGYFEGRVATGCDHMLGAETVYNGKDYSLVYDYTDYIKNNPDVFKAFKYNSQAVLKHFVENGMREGRIAKASFNVRSYFLEYSDLRAAFGNNNALYYKHYMEYGYKENRHTTGCTQMVNAGTKSGGIDYSPVYDFNYYINHNPDVLRAFGYNEKAVLNHFVNYGMKEGRQGNENFQVGAYRNIYPDVRHLFKNDLAKYYLHYIQYGQKEGRKSANCDKVLSAVTVANGIDYASVYDYNYYVRNNPDVYKAFGCDDIAVLNHFITYGMKEGRKSSENFNLVNYRNRYADLRAAFGNNYASYYQHYVTYGIKEGRTCN